MLPQINNEIFNKYKKVLLDYLEKVKLAICKKCDLCFCPANDDNCYSYYHKGKQIPFEGGNMEEIVVDDDDEPCIMVNYSCCGECALNDVPLNCGVRENGKHEIKKEISKFKIKKC